MVVLNKSIISQYIESLADKHEAYIIGYNVSVWALIDYFHAAKGDVALVVAGYGLPKKP
jgi:hypothetical protein